MKLSIREFTKGKHKRRFSAKYEKMKFWKLEYDAWPFNEWKEISKPNE
jgi:hypothetical protein